MRLCVVVFWSDIVHLIINYRIKIAQTKDLPWIIYVERIQLIIVIITINGLRNDIVIAHIWWSFICYNEHFMENAQQRQKKIHSKFRKIKNFTTNASMGWKFDYFFCVFCQLNTKFHSLISKLFACTKHWNAISLTEISLVFPLLYIYFSAHVICRKFSLFFSIPNFY